MINYRLYDSPVGTLLLLANPSGLLEIRFTRTHSAGLSQLEQSWHQGSALLQACAAQLDGYFTGQLMHFDLPLVYRGTAFQQQVLRALECIPYGRTTSYGELAQQIGRQGAARAVGSANRRNPLPIVIPCHRVIGANGELTGYAGGLDIKQQLLAIEQRTLEDKHASNERDG